VEQQLDFFKTSMPKTRLADYYLGFLDGCIFIDFNLSKDNRIYLKRISFDGFGCCNLNEKVTPLTKEESKLFIDTYKKDELCQEIMSKLIIGTIKINEEHIWQDALKKYSLVD
jgi:hypothetical protein